MTRGRLIGFGLALLVGVAIGLALWPMVEREWMLRRLFSDDAEQRAIAIQWWRESDGSGVDSRLAADTDIARRIAARLERTEDQGTFIDVAALLREEEFWRVPTISSSLWRRRLDLILDSNDLEAALSVLDEVAAVPLARDDPNAIDLWRRLLDWPHHAAVRRQSLLAAARWFDRGAFETFVAPRRDDDDAQVRRLAWLLLGHVQPRAGYAAVWKGKEPHVAEAMLWAATVTNPQDASPLLTACDASPWPTPALPWLLSRSDDPAARERLEALVVDGNQAATLHLAQRWGTKIEDLPAPQRAWLGGVIEEDATHDIALSRWAAWRNRSGDAERLLADPVAEDGSVWSAVLLAERLLDGEAQAELARKWLSDTDTRTRCAGAYLHALSKRDGRRLSAEYAQSGDAAFRRAVRMAMIIADSGVQRIEMAGSDHAYAWTIVATQSGERLEALMALLAGGDAQPVEAILTAPDDTPAGAALLERAWLIERFLPDYAALVGPLCPWDDAVAALQFDIMAAAWALGGGADRFDREKRVFAYAAATAPAR